MNSKLHLPSFNPHPTTLNAPTATDSAQRRLIAFFRWVSVDKRLTAAYTKHPAANRVELWFTSRSHSYEDPTAGDPGREALGSLDARVMASIRVTIW